MTACGLPRRVRSTAVAADAYPVDDFGEVERASADWLFVHSAHSSVSAFDVPSVLLYSSGMSGTGNTPGAHHNGGHHDYTDTHHTAGRQPAARMEDLVT